MIDEREREIVIKEARLAALHDIEAALRTLARESLVSEEVKEAARFIGHYIGQRVSAVARDQADRQRLSHTPWGGQEEGSSPREEKGGNAVVAAAEGVNDG